MKRTLIISVLLVLSLISLAAEAMENIKLTFHFSDGDVPAIVDPETIKVLFNPKEYIITKATPWKHHDIQGLDAPELEFTSGEPFRLEMELFFDSYEEGKDVREYTSKIESLVNNSCVVTWGTKQLKCVLESFNLSFTLFSDGVPVRAVMNTVWEEFSPAEEQLEGRARHGNETINLTEKVLDIMENRFNEGWPSILDLIPASQNSIPILKAYNADSFQDVVDIMFENFETETRIYDLISVNQANCSTANSAVVNAEASVSDKFCQVRGFKVKIDSAGGKEYDTAWEHVSGGELIIEVTETTVGSDKFQTTTPGHKSVGEITLRGAFTADRKAVMEWINSVNKNNSFSCSRCVNVSFSFFNESDDLEFKNLLALDYSIFNNQLFFLTTDNDSLNALVFNIKRTRQDGSQYNGPPRIFIILPASGPAFMPVAIGGMNFDEGAIPFFSNTPSIALFNFGTRNLPLIGSISVGMTIVPPAAPTGPGNVVVEYFGQRSNPFPFTVN